ncbi:MAG: hypothetical protein WCE82_07885 [Halobacteriota archaeon]
MQLIRKSKVTKLNAKTGIIYPLIRLSKIYAGEIGKTAEIFESKLENKRALVLTFDEQAETGSEVIQLLPKVIQLDCQEDLEARPVNSNHESRSLNHFFSKTKIKKPSPEPVISSKHPRKSMGSAGFEPATSAV